MAAIFSQILNMSMTGSVVILLVLLARLLLKRSPKIYSYALWSVVLFRLLCPAAFTAPVSVLNVVEPEQKETSNNTSIVTYIPATVNTQADFIMVQPEEQPMQMESVTEPEDKLRMTPMHAAALVWAAGMAGMMLYSVVQYLTLQRKLVGSVQLKGNIYLADHIDTAFVVGLLQPRIYLPSGVPEKECYYILAHEQHHIRRGDHIIKLVAYLALCIHWFNPLVWLSFVLAGKDMEMSCDEAVIKKLGAEIRADYSASLLRLATHKKILSGMPLAFGEGDTKGRVMNMAKWKKPKVWVSLICLLLCAAVLVACAVNPVDEEYSDEQQTEQLPLVDSVELEPVVDGSMIITDTELVQYGTLKMRLPSGFAAREQDGTIVLMKDSVDVGGITCWSHPGFEPDNIVEWMKALGIPELQEDYEVPIGYMAGGSSYGDFEIEIFWDGNPDALNIEHQFFVDGNIVYDVWYDQNLISDGIAERFLKTIAINADPVIEENPDEQAAFAKCRAVLEAVQQGSYKIVSRRINSGAQVPNGFVHTYSKINEDWLSSTTVISEVGSIEDGLVGEKYGATSSSLCANGKRFRFTGAEWAEIANNDSALLPWLAEFTWDENIVAYMDTLTDEDGECIMLHVDEKYIDSDEYDPHYFLYFNFDPNGNFVNAQLQVNLFRDNEINITESIASLDADTINAEIQKEYQNAIG